MFARIVFVFGLVGLVAACEEVTPVSPTPNGAGAKTAKPAKSSAAFQNAAQAQRAFAQVTARLEPVAERECRNRTTGVNCDFRIIVDTNPKKRPNAYQKLEKSGRPVITFNIGLIKEARNADELAFVMGHEAAHHIGGHIRKQHQNAVAGAVIFAGLATLGGADPSAIQSATELGAEVGARSYSKDFELEADQLGTIITARAGYSPLKGAEFFSRIPDPGDRFLGTHPPNAARIRIVRQTVSQL